MCILRGAMFCASFEVLCFVHPSRCFVRSVVVLFGEKRLPRFPSFFLPEGSFLEVAFYEGKLL